MVDIACYLSARHINARYISLRYFTQKRISHYPINNSQEPANGMYGGNSYLSAVVVATKVAAGSEAKAQ